MTNATVLLFNDRLAVTTDAAGECPFCAKHPRQHLVFVAPVTDVATTVTGADVVFTAGQQRVQCQCSTNVLTALHDIVK